MRPRLRAPGAPFVRSRIFSRAISTDILDFRARVVVTAGERPAFLEELSGASERPMIIPMTITARPQQRYDHRLRNLVHHTGDVTIATDLGVPRGTARGWLSRAPEVIVSLDVTHLSELELQHEILTLRRRESQRPFAVETRRAHAGRFEQLLPDADLAGDADVPACWFHHGVRQGQPEADALPLALGGEEWVQHLSHDLARHARPGVAHHERRVTVPPGGQRRGGWVSRRRRRVHLDGHRAAVRHRVPRIQDEVHDNLFEVDTVGGHQVFGCGQTRPYRHLLADQRLQCDVCRPSPILTS